MSNETTAGKDYLVRAFASTRAVLATVGPEHLGLATPCASWDVRELIDHFVGSARWAAASVGGDVSEGDRGGEDFLGRYDRSAAVALAAFEADGVLDKTFGLEFGEFTGAAVLGLACNDQFTHGWDLARAIGHHTDLDPELADELLAQAKVAVPEAYRGADGVGLFGPAVEPSAGASPADRLAAFLGRSA